MTNAFDSDVAKLADDMWFTRKARIHAENRLLKNEMHSQFLMITYSVYSIALSVLLLVYKSLEQDCANVFSVVLSVILFGISLTLAARGFKERAALFRKNYLKIQTLIFEIKKINWISDDGQKNDIYVSVSQKYTALLDESENHLQIDDICSRVGAQNLSTRKPTKVESARYYFYRLWKFLTLGALYTLPILVLIALFIFGLLHA